MATGIHMGGKPLMVYAKTLLVSSIQVATHSGYIFGALLAIRRAASCEIVVDRLSGHLDAQQLRSNKVARHFGLKKDTA